MNLILCISKWFLFAYVTDDPIMCLITHTGPGSPRSMEVILQMDSGESE